MYDTIQNCKLTIISWVFNIWCTRFKSITTNTTHIFINSPLPYGSRVIATGGNNNGTETIHCIMVKHESGDHEVRVSGGDMNAGESMKSFSDAITQLRMLAGSPQGQSYAMPSQGQPYAVPPQGQPGPPKPPVPPTQPRQVPAPPASK